MNFAETETRARAFFDEFVEAFRSFDGATIAARYLAPYLAFHGHGAAQVFQANTETAAYFQRVLDEYRAQGCRSCRYRDLEVAAIGEECALGTVTWELLAEDLSVVSAWRESYNLCLLDDRFVAFASVDHVA